MEFRKEILTALAGTLLERGVNAAIDHWKSAVNTVVSGAVGMGLLTFVTNNDAPYASQPQPPPDQVVAVPEPPLGMPSYVEADPVEPEEAVPEIASVAVTEPLDAIRAENQRLRLQLNDLRRASLRQTVVERCYPDTPVTWPPLGSS